MKRIIPGLLLSVVIGANGVHAVEKTEKNKNAYCVILAGGSGTRLWPLSREEKSKQFLSIAGEKTLLEQAVDRVSDSVPQGNIWVVTTKEQELLVQNCVGDKIGNIVIEPGPRNTGPAILLSCFEVYKQNSDASIVFLPSDPFIPSKEHFVSFLDRAIDYMLTNDRIALLGLKPRYPATGYGYIEYDKNSSEQAPFDVITFHEKPARDVAQRYCKQENMLWNICMFCAKVSVFLKEFQSVAPQIFKGVKAYVEGAGQYLDVIAESIDYAVMEKSSLVSVFPADFEWCDVGNIEQFLSIQNQHNQNKEKVVSIDSHNNLVQSKKLVALVGVDDLCVVETENTVLITKRDQAEKVRQVVQQLKASDFNHYL